MSRNAGRTPHGRLSPDALRDARRVLDGAARRLLAEQLNGDAIGSAAGRNGHRFHDGHDERPALLKRQLVPVPGSDGDGGGLGGGEAV